ncbi:MAG: sodium:calcium antiporter [Euryarchaeota archaeon]|nr:sodium:calcium antiporter [Euryarchaeota archaeon]
MLWLLPFLAVILAGQFLYLRKRDPRFRPRRAAMLAAVPAGSLPSNPVSYLWPFPAVIGSAFAIGWAAEVAQFILSQGFALAILAWLQVLPEFAVEGAIAWRAAHDPEAIHLVTANFTGANRILIGVGWPLIFFTAWAFARRRGEAYREVSLRPDHSIEVVALLVPTLYFVAIYLKGTLTLVDTAILTGLYGFYLWLLNRLPPEEESEKEHIGKIPREVLRRSRRVQVLFAVGVFLAGGIVLYYSAEPFLAAMLAIALSLGFSEFLFIQWFAPFLSEFPEKVTSFRWATSIRLAPMALMNMISSKVNQWTALVAMIPIVYVAGLGRIEDIPLGDIHGLQRVEILLTIAQSIYAVALLLKMRFTRLDALLLFAFWLFQFLEPGLREEMVLVYLAVALATVVLHRKELRALRDFRQTLRTSREQKKKTPA